MEALLVIGVGNPIRGDDALGWAVAEGLQERLPAGVAECVCVQQLTMDLVEPVSQARAVYFVDARTGAPPGELFSATITANTSLDSPASHFFDPQTLLAAVQALYGSHPPAYLLTIGAASFAYGADLSAPVREAVIRLVDDLALQFTRQGQPATV